MEIKASLRLYPHPPIFPITISNSISKELKSIIELDIPGESRRKFSRLFFYD